MSERNSNVENSNATASFLSHTTIPEPQTFCVVCGRFGSDFVVRKSGLKCVGCVGKTAKKSYTRLQHKQATEFLSRAMARAHMGYPTPPPSSLGESMVCSNFGVSGCEGAEMARPHGCPGSGKMWGTQSASCSRPECSDSLSMLRDEGLKASARASQKPQIMDYIDNTACYQAAAAAICAADMLSCTSNQVDALTPGPTDDSALNDTANFMASTSTMPSARRGAATLRQHTPVVRAGEPLTRDRCVRDYEKETLKKKKEEHSLEAMRKGNEEEEEEEEETTPVVCKDAGLTLSAKQRSCDLRRKESCLVRKRAVVVMDTMDAPKLSIDEGNTNDNADQDKGVDSPANILPSTSDSALGSVISDPFPANELANLSDVSMDDEFTTFPLETQKDPGPTLVSKRNRNRRPIMSPRRPSSILFVKSLNATPPTETCCFETLPARRSSLRSPQACTEGSSLAATTSNLSLPNTVSVQPSFCHDITDRSVSGKTVKRTKMCGQTLNHQKETHSRQSRQVPRHVNPAFADLVSRETPSCSPLVTFLSTPASPASPASSSSSSESSQGRFALKKSQPFSGTASQMKASIGVEDTPKFSNLNIDRLCVTVEIPQFLQQGESLARGDRFSSSLPTRASDQVTPVSFAAESGLAVTKSSFLLRSSHSDANSSAAARPGYARRVYSPTGGTDGTSRRVTGGLSSDKVEVNTFSFLLCLRDRDTNEFFYSVEHRYHDIVPVLHEMKYLMSTLPPVPRACDPGVRYVSKSFLLERLAECQAFFDAVVQNYFMIHHPKMVELLQLGPHFQQASAAYGVEKRDCPRQAGRLKSNLSSLGASNSLPATQQLNDSALEQFRAGSLLKGPSKFRSTSSCVSTASSVVRRGDMDAISEEDLERVQLGDMLGRGSFGTVYMGLVPGHSALVAVKVVRINENVGEDFFASVSKEIDILRAARHKNIIRFFGSTYLAKERELRVFTEYVECGNISSMVKKFGSLPLVVIQNYMIQILKGLHYLHTMGIVHRDIKGENILVTKKGRCKLADFGCSGTLYYGVEGQEGVQGSPLWMAPEIINGMSPAPSGDIWALGCVGIEMLRRPIWNIATDANPYISLYHIGKMNGIPHGLPTMEELESFRGLEEHGCFSLYRDFLCCCLRVKAEERWSAMGLLSHAFLRHSLPNSLRWTPPEVVGDEMK